MSLSIVKARLVVVDNMTTHQFAFNNANSTLTFSTAMLDANIDINASIVLVDSQVRNDTLACFSCLCRR